MASSSTRNIVEEKKDAGLTASGDYDDAVLWSENPEQAYFRSMIEDQKMGRIADGKDADDSVLGNETLASLMEEGHRSKKNKENDNDDDLNKYEPDYNDFSLPVYPQAPFTMAIIGKDDDLSTIDNDSIRGPPPTKVTTPERKKRADSDEDTAPETPPGDRFNKSNGKDKSKREMQDEKEEKDGLSKGEFGMSVRSKRIYIGALLTGCLLLFSVIGLSVALKQLREEDVAEPAPTNNQGAEFPDGFLTGPPVSLMPPVAAPISAPVETPTVPPATAPTPDTAPTSPNIPPAGPPGETANPMASPTKRPSASPVQPTEAPTFAPVTSPPTFPPGHEADLVALLQERGDASILDALEDTGSPQYLSFTWVANDPNYEDYGPDRIIQRYALGVLGLTLHDGPGRNRRLQGSSIVSEASVLSDWLSAEDECTWASSRGNQNICNGQGMYTHLELRNLGLFGTVPKELSLLSNSLRNLVLDGNNLHGSIPSEIGRLKDLTRLQFTANSMDGTIPTEVGELDNLELLGLGRNSFEGSLPTELGNLRNLATLDFASNNINGTIPLEFQNLVRLQYLILKDNELTGSVPGFLTDLDRLVKLDLGFNLLFGEMPNRVCNFRNLETLAADCNLVACDCCTNCGDPNARLPTPPTQAPIFVPTVQPTRAPSAAPSQCQSSIEVASCIERDEPIRVNFHNCNPDVDDWIGIFPSWANPQDDTPYLWVWTCGSQGCRGQVELGSVVLTAEHIGEGSDADWPLRRDDYQAFLIPRNRGGDAFVTKASSEEFEIDNNC